MAQDPMEYIWEKTAKLVDPGGQKIIHYTNNEELAYLYDSGFVDTAKFTIEQWRAAYADSLQPDGSYKVTHNQWLAKRPFRYNGPIPTPFDPLKLPDGDISRDEMTALVKKEIVPATPLKETQIPQFVDALALRYLSKEGKFMVGAGLKKELAWLLENHPSPFRRLQLRVANVIETRKQATTAQAAALAASLFSKGKSSDEKAAQKIAAIEKTKRPEVIIQPKEKMTDLKTELKKRKKQEKL